MISRVTVSGRSPLIHAVCKAGDEVDWTVLIIAALSETGA
jgi:hypothetical protein